jgi:hypothetical protein
MAPKREKERGNRKRGKRFDTANYKRKDCQDWLVWGIKADARGNYVCITDSIINTSSYNASGDARSLAPRLAFPTGERNALSPFR